MSLMVIIFLIYVVSLSLSSLLFLPSFHSHFVFVSIHAQTCNPISDASPKPPGQSLANRHGFTVCRRRVNRNRRLHGARMASPSLGTTNWRSTKKGKNENGAVSHTSRHMCTYIYYTLTWLLMRHDLLCTVYTRAHLTF